MVRIAKFGSSKLEIFENCLIYKKLFKGYITIQYSEVGNMTATVIVDGDKTYYVLTLFDNVWHEINLSSFSTNHRLQIIQFMNDTLTPIVMPKLIDRFEQSLDVNLGYLSVNKRQGIIRTNNIKRLIPWHAIKSMEVWIVSSGVGKAKIDFYDANGEGVFEFLFSIGNIVKHTLMLEVFRNMLGEGNIKDFTS